MDYFKPKRESIGSDNFGSFSVTSYNINKDNMTEDLALSIPTVSNCVDLICASVSQLPLYLYEKQPDGSVVRIDSNGREYLLNECPNPMLNGYNFKKTITKQFLFYGASYTKPERKGNTFTALYPLDTKNITIQKYQRGYKHDAKIKFLTCAEEITFVPEELISILRDSIDGISSNGILNQNSNILKLAIEELEYSKNIVANGAIPSGLLYTDGKLTDKSAATLRDDWQKLYGGAENAGKTPVLEGGLKYQQVSMKPNDLDLVNSKKNTVAELCKLFNVPESMVNSNANKYASNEANGIQFLQYCMAPVLYAIESGLNNWFLLEEEKKGSIFWRFDVSELLRTTEKEKIETVARGLESRLFSRNEAREKLGMPILKEDIFLYKLGDVFYNPETNMLTVANTGTSINLDDLKTKLDILEIEADIEVKKAEELAKIAQKYAPKQENTNKNKSGGAEPDGNGKKKSKSGVKE